MLAKKWVRVWFHTSPATLLRLKGMLKKHVFPSVMQQLLKEKMQCLGHGCHVADTCWEKRREFGSILHLPCCYFWRGCWKHMFCFLLKRYKLQRFGHKRFILKSCHFDGKCWQKMGESLVPYFTCHSATFEGDVQKKPCFSQCFATTAERKKCNVWVISVFYLKSCHVADTCWKKGENLVLYCACHTTTFEEDVEKIMFFLTVLQQLLKR